MDLREKRLAKAEAVGIVVPIESTHSLVTFRGSFV